MNMRKLFSLLLAFVLVLAMLVGCSSVEDISGQVTPLEEPTQPLEIEIPEEPEIVVPEAEITELPEEAEQSDPFTLGQIEGGVYTNNYLGIGCTLDENWVFYSAEELQALPENVREMLKDTEAGELLDGVAQIMDMKAENMTEMATINVLYSPQSLQTQLAYAAMTEEAFLDSVLLSKDVMISAYTDMGMENVEIEKAVVTFLGEEHFAIKTTAVEQGLNRYMLQVYDMSGAFGATLTVTSYNEDITQELLDLFYKI